MIAAGDFRKGITIEYDFNVYVITEFQHVKPGKGAAFVRTRLKNVVSGAVLEKTFNPSEKVPKAHIETKVMQYLYSDGELYYFMDNETYEQLPLNRAQVEDALMFIKENMSATIKFFKGAAFSVEPPNFVELVVTATEPGFKGDTSSGGTKPATMETGLELQVPLFISQGETIRIDTRTGEYMERAK
jgi:elongation factor P